jgi:hypothetical protein
MLFIKSSIFTLLMLIFIATMSWGQSAPSFTDESMIRLASEIQTCRQLVNESIPVYKEAIEQANKLLEVKDQIIVKDQKIIDLQKEEIEILKQHIQFQKNTIDVMTEVSNKALKDVKPSLLDTMKTMSIGVMIGMIIGLVL